MIRLAVPAVVLAVVLAGASPAAAQSLPEQAQAIVDRLVATLTDLAKWSDEQKLYGTRDSAYAIVLLYAPEHAAARQTLKYVKRAGEWVQQGYKPGTNRNEEAEPEGQRRLQEATAEFLDALLGLARGAGEDVPEADKKAVISEILKYEPNHEEARRLNGEARLREKWVLIETATADARRKELIAFAKESIAAVKEPALEVVNEVEAGLGVRWTNVYQGEWWRAVGTVPDPELRRALACLDASDVVFSKIFGAELTRPAGSGFYLLRGLEDAKTVLGKHPALTPAQREYFLTLKAAWLPGKHVFFQWSDTPEVRLDGSVRMPMGILMMKVFGVNTDRGWVWEGLGCALVELMTGTHRVVFVTPEVVTRAGEVEKFDIAKRMKAAGANWLSLARELYDGGAAPDLRAMTKKRVNDMTPDELVVAYALARFIFEGYPEKAGQFFVMHGCHEPLEDTVKRVFKWPLERFEKQLHRWLKEM